MLRVIVAVIMSVALGLFMGWLAVKICDIQEIAQKKLRDEWKKD